MTFKWTWEDISKNWNLNTRIDYNPSEVVDAFNNIQKIMGAEWFDKWDKQRGPFIAIETTELWRLLKEIKVLPGSKKLIERLKKGDDSAKAEALVAAYYSRNGLKVELEPELVVGSKTKKPDLRIKLGNNWGYIEITKPISSKHQKRINSKMMEISQCIKTVELPRHIEVYLYKEPTEKEVSKIVALGEELASNKTQPQSIRIEGLAQIFCGIQGTEHKLSNFEDNLREKRPVLFNTSLMKSGGVFKRCNVELPFTDERAQRILNAEAKQLSREEPGLAILDVSGIPGGLQLWPGLIKRQLQPTRNRRIGGVLFINQSFTVHQLLIETKLIKNQYALHQLPDEFLTLTERLTNK